MGSTGYVPERKSGDGLLSEQRRRVAICDSLKEGLEMGVGREGDRGSEDRV